MTTQNPEAECCPRFDPAPWDNKHFEWDKKKFVRDKVFTLFYIPVNFGSVMKRIDGKVRAAGATIQEGMGLSDHTSKWNMDIYVAVDREVPGANNATLSGNFLSKVYEGDFKNTSKWCHDFEDSARATNFKVKKEFMWYTTCPKCARKYGKNYVAIVAEVE